MSKGASGIKAGAAYIELGVRNKMSQGLRDAQKRMELFGERVREIGSSVAMAGAAMAAFGFSLNNISLFGLVLAIGIVVDDAIAFVGGLDLTGARWDTPEHRVDNPLRTDRDGKPYAPCAGSFTTPKLRPGRHRFDVVATDSVGNRDASAATFLWKALTSKISRSAVTAWRRRNRPRWPSPARCWPWW